METPRVLPGGDVMAGRGIDQVLPRPGGPCLHVRLVHDARGDDARWAGPPA